jgi:hypothetical protein
MHVPFFAKWPEKLLKTPNMIKEFIILIYSVLFLEQQILNHQNIKGYPFKPIYTNITSEDGTILRIHHIDEGPRDGPILLAMHGQPVWSYLYSK